MTVQQTRRRCDFDFSIALVVSEKAEGGDDRRLEAVAGFASLELAEVGIEDARAAAGREAVEEAFVQDVVDGVASVMAADSAPGRVAADEFTDGSSVAELTRNHESVARLGAVFRMPAAGEDLLGDFLGQRFRGSDGMGEIGDAAQAEGKVLADDAGDAATPDVADAIAHGEIRVVGRVARNVAHALHDVCTEVGDGLCVVDPDRDAAVVLH